MVAKVHGEFAGHSHPDTDDLFLVLRGNLIIKLRDGTVRVGPGDLYVVPKGGSITHLPKTKSTCCSSKRLVRPILKT